MYLFYFMYLCSYVPNDPIPAQDTLFTVHSSLCSVTVQITGPKCNRPYQNIINQKTWPCAPLYVRLSVRVHAHMCLYVPVCSCAIFSVRTAVCAFSVCVLFLFFCFCVSSMCVSPICVSVRMCVSVCRCQDSIWVCES